MDVIYVNGKPFMGRVEEQKQFRAALRETLVPPNGETLPYVILLYGDGGMGKTTLSTRFYDIACDEPPFESEVQFMKVDWEEERRLWVELQTGRENIRAESVFDILHNAAKRNEWEKYFEAYRKTRDERKQAEAAALRALESSGERDDLAAIRGLGAESLAALVRKALPIGDTGEKLTKAFLEAGIRSGAEGLAALRSSMETRLRSRLSVPQFDLYLNPHEALARALADGFKRLSEKHPLLVVLDTYEIVDRADPWLRLVLLHAGARITWVVSGRDNLRDSRSLGAGEYFRGYGEDFPRRLLDYDMAQLALQDVKDYFTVKVPQRPLDEDAAQAIRRVTYGIPLAMAQAADMWEKNIALEEIAPPSGGDRLPAREIVRRMTDRYLLHVVREEDKRALYAMALARGDLETLHDMLVPADGSPFDLEAELTRLERAYASVVAMEGRLHDEPQEFLLAYLREPIMRQGDLLRGLLTRAEGSLTRRLTHLEVDLPLLEERCLDEDWRKLTLLLAEILFWQEEERAWKFFLPRLVDSFAYSRDLLGALLQTASIWEKNLSSRGKRRLNALLPTNVERLKNLSHELIHVEEMGYFKGIYENERHTILVWLRGLVLLRQDRLSDALRELETAERGLPQNGETLRKKLADTFYDLAGKLTWQKDAFVYHPDAVRILQKVTAWQPQKQGVWYRLGVVLERAGNLKEAIPAYQKAIALDEKDAFSWNGLGSVYDDMGEHEKAIQIYQKAIALDEKFADPWNGLGIVYQEMGEYEKAIQAYQKAITLDEKDPYPWNNLGNVYDSMSESEKAIQAYQKAITLPNSFGTPTNAHALAWNGLGDIYRDTSKPDEALQAYQKSIALDKKFAYPWNGLGAIYRDMGKHKEALQAYQKSIALDEKFAHPWNGLGLLYENQGDYDKSIECYQKALDIDHKYKWAQNNLGDVYHKQGKDEDAIQAYQKAIVLDDKFSSPWDNLGMIYTVQGNWEEALNAYRRAVELEPEDGTYRSSLVGVLRRLNREAEAQEEMARARPLMEKESEYNRACFAAICGETEEALSLLEVALQKGEEPKNWARQDPDFESIREHPKFKELTT